MSRYTTFGSRDAAQYEIENRGESNRTVIADTGLDSEVGSADPSHIDDDDEYEDTVRYSSIFYTVLYSVNVELTVILQP